MKYATVGPISEGTLKTEDLLDAFAWELEYHVEHNFDSLAPLNIFRYAKLCGEAEAFAHADAQDEEYKSETLSKLCDALSEFASDYMYFGTPEGDGACFGFWIDQTMLDEANALRVSDTSEVPSDFSGEVLHTNDHGNITLYTADHGKLIEVWSVV